ncbi:MAG: hypothetical protein AAFO29_17360 [Actinomycetota bacterium]
MGALAVVVFMVVGIGVSIRAVIKRDEPVPRARRASQRRLWNSFARRRGLHYEPGPDPALGRSFRYLQLAGNVSDAATGWAAWDIVNGNRRGRAVLMLTVSFRDPEKNRDRHLSVAAVQAADQPLPDLRIRPEGTKTRLGNLFRNEDIDLDSIEFSRAFELASPDRRFATEFCGPAVIDFLLARPSMELETYGPWLLTATEGPTDPGEVEANLDLLFDLLDVVPAHVLER